MSVLVDQALYGYDRGHRLLESSRPIDGQAGRLLRAVSDMAFDGQSDHYLTVLPVANLRSQAFIRSWPAPEGMRPGSVWSHVLLVDFVDLAEIENVDVLLRLFRHPLAQTPPKPGSYSGQLTLPPSASRTADTREFDLALAQHLVGAVYGRPGGVSLATPRLEDAEEILLAIWEQQWPRLRRTFSFRTRKRPSENPSARFDVEVVERSAPSNGPEPAISSDWLQALIRDLLHPEISFRRLLRTLAADSTERSEAPGVVEVISSLRRGAPPDEIVGQVARTFPRPDQMRTLKRTLLGHPEPSSVAVEFWHVEEAVRLGLVLHSEPRSFDFDDLAIPERLAAMWEHDPQAAVFILSELSASTFSEEQVDVLVENAVVNAPGEQLSELATRAPDLVQVVLRRRPDLLQSPQIWNPRSPLMPQLLDLFRRLDAETRYETFFSFIREDYVDAAAQVCAAQPTLWWAAVTDVASTSGTGQELISLASTLRHVLDEVGPASVGRPTPTLNTFQELVVAAWAADLSSGLWRQVQARSWIAAAEEPAPANFRSEEWNETLLRLSVIALSAGIDSGTETARRRAWKASFGPLHNALVEQRANDEVWSVLDRLLPSGSDLAARLRAGLIAEIRRDKWSVAETEAMLASVPRYGEIIRAALDTEKTQKKRSRGWLRDLIDHMVP